jgi:hypothetical protein
MEARSSRVAGHGKKVVVRCRHDEPLAIPVHHRHGIKEGVVFEPKLTIADENKQGWSSFSIGIGSLTGV